MALNKNAGAAGHYESSLSYAVLRACSNCRNKHPLAYDPPLPADRCPSCGFPIVPPEPTIVDPPVITDGRLRLGVRLMEWGRRLHRLAERLEP